MAAYRRGWAAMVERTIPGVQNTYFQQRGTGNDKTFYMDYTQPLGPALGTYRSFTPASVKLDYYTSKTNQRSFTFSSFGGDFQFYPLSDGGNFGIGIHFPDISTHLAKFNKLYRIVVTETNGDIWNLNIGKAYLYLLTNPTTVTRSTVNAFLRNRTLTAMASNTAPNRLTLTINASFFNSDALWAITDVDDIVGKNAGDFPIVLSARDAAYEIAGGFVDNRLPNVKIGVFPNPDNRDFAGWRATKATGNLFPVVTEVPPAPERDRIALGNWETTAQANIISAELIQVPDIPQSSIRGIRFQASVNPNLSSSASRNYPTETATNRYQFQFTANRTNYVRCVITLTDGDSIQTPIYVIRVANNRVDVQTAAQVNSLFRLVPAAITNITNRAISVRLQSDLFLDERLTQVKMSVTPTTPSKVITVDNTGANAWLDMTVEGLDQSTLYTLTFAFTWLGIEVAGFDFKVRTIRTQDRNQHTIPVTERNIDTIVNKLTDSDSYESYYVQDFNTKLEIAKGLVQGKIAKDTNIQAIDQNPNTADLLRGVNRSRTVFSKETGETIQDIVARAMLTVPEPNEDRDLYLEVR